MGYYKDEDIAGVRNDEGEIWCRECMKEEEWNSLPQQIIVTQQEIDKGEGYFFCNQCGKRM